MKITFIFKKIIFLASLLTSWSLSYSQNWAPVFPNEIFDYKTDTSKRIEQVVKVDSANSNIYYLNKIASSCCIDDFNDLNYLINLPVFLQYSIIIDDSDFILKGPNTWIVKTSYPLNKQWLYDSLNNISAEIVSRRSQKRYGQKDSVETIILSPGNDSIVLSKNFGILNFPSGSGHYFIQSGLEKAKLGKVRLGFDDYYSFDAGDVFQYEQGEGNVNSEISTSQNWKNTIISKTDLNPGYMYRARQVWNYSWSDGTGGFIESGIDTVSLIYLPGLDDTASYLIYPGEWQETPYYLYSIGQLIYDSQNNQLGCYVNSFSQFSGSTPIWLPPADTCCSPNDTIPSVPGEEILNYEYSLRKGLGQVENTIYYFEGGLADIMTGYVKGADTVNIYPDSYFLTGIKASPLNKVKWFLYPNPANNTIFLSSSIPIANDFKIEFINMEGQMVKNIYLPANSLKWQISVADIQNGLYIVDVRSKGQIDYRSKILVVH